MNPSQIIQLIISLASNPSLVIHYRAGETNKTENINLEETANIIIALASIISSKV